ncbi:MAG: L-fuco-beta-pyranose dehydrogenase [Candidatus Carbobacillus altaicus]|uniref:L-fuco-beta-pyranose dehydrogenase n=1 Tax=Candidatus Carbonibacillus altaicus TaxID=2163959 RepID=A0A2R6XXN0_9BACL|nr:MAG: L-fuco-beta-pyranose dehydrogenase [Candidatus Carbobacillus altaicus]
MPPLGIGTWQWGDRFIWGYGRRYREDDLKEAFFTAVRHGIRLFDTAEMYGLGRSETLLGMFLKEYEKSAEAYEQNMAVGTVRLVEGALSSKRASSSALVLVSKFFPYPWRMHPSDLIRALNKTLKRLDRSKLDLYLLHWPWGPRSIETWMEAMAEAVRRGLVRAVGVSNCTVEQLKRAQDRLSRYGIPLAANQVEYSLLVRSPENNGLLSYMRSSGVRLMAYSPLAMGWLTGRYTIEHPPGGYRNRYRRDPRLPIVLQTLREIAQKHKAEPAHIALAWLITKGAVPIPGATHARQAASNAMALAVQLDEEDVERLDQV